MEAIYEAYPSGPGVQTPIDKVLLIPGAGGVFDVKADGDLVYSKHQTGRHAEIAEILDAVKARI